MQIEIGDLRRLPFPVLTPAATADLDALGHRAVAAKEAIDTGRVGEQLAEIEGDVDRYARDLYGVPANADLWVVR